MPAPSSSIRFNLVGSLPHGEIFDTGFWTVGVAVTDAATANTMAARIASRFAEDLYLNIRALCDADTAYTQVRAYCYPGGGTRADAIGEAPIAVGVGTGSVQSNPLQTSLVCTLRTGLAGRRHRGRMYLPANAWPITDHQFADGGVDSVATAMKTFLQNVNLDGTLGTCAVVSNVASTATPIKSVTVDTKPDIQRRRSSSMTARHNASSTLI